MFKQLAELALQCLNLTRDMLQMKEDFKLVREEVKNIRADLATLQRSQEQTLRVIDRLAYEVQRTGDHDESKRRLLVLQLENKMLEFERRLPSSGETDSPPC